MKLYHSPASPFVRKVRIAAGILGLPLTLEEVSPYDAPAQLVAASPLSKVPVLELDDGSVVFDSPVIVQVLDEMAGGVLLPASGPARWAALRGEALGDGLSEAALARTMENRRPESLRSSEALAHQEKAIFRVLALLEENPPPLPASSGGMPTLPAIALIAGLDYLDLRHGDLGWRRGHPRLSAWAEDISAHPDVAAPWSFPRGPVGEAQKTPA